MNMKIVCTAVLFICSYFSYAQQLHNLTGVYLHTGSAYNTLWLIQDQYLSQIQYNPHSYISTQGGPFSLSGNQLRYNIEYFDAVPDSVGLQKTEILQVKDGELWVNGKVFIKQKANSQDLDGLWRITGRMTTENKIDEIPRGDRKTVKILVDGFFQWIAINPASKGFYGTGGGTYTLQNGKYTEKVLFFSRDNSRIGATLGFNGEIKNDKWHHSGFSSKGDPIYEVWSRD